MSDEEDAIATIILELEDKFKWSQSFTDFQDLLANLTAEAITEYRSGKTVI